MAVFNLAITYPDAQQTRIMDALKQAAATSVNPTPSNAQAIEWLRQRVIGVVKGTVRDMEVRTAQNAVVDVDAT